MHRPRILVTGFGPFPGVPFNVSATLVEALDEHHRRHPASYDFHGAILTTDWRAGPERAEALIRELTPDAVVHFGVSSRATTMQIETRAFNIARCAADHTGHLERGHYVRRGGPPVLAATLPARRLASDLKRSGIPASFSRDAGRYLCNATLYRSLELARSSRPYMRVGFIHIPALTPDQMEGALPLGHSCDLRIVEHGAHVILASLARTLQTATQPSRRTGGNQIQAGLVLGGIAHDNRPSRLSDGGQRRRWRGDVSSF